MPTIEYRVLTSDDEDEIREIVCRHFFVQETMCNAFCLDADKVGNAFADVIFEKYLAQGVSLGAFDSETGKMVGIRLTGIISKANAEENLFSKDDPKTREIALLMEPVKILHDNLNMYEKYGVDKLASFRGLSVIENYQRLGIATRLVEKALEVIKGKGLHVVSAESSSRFSKRIFDKTGFEELASLPYTEIKFDGKPVPMTEDMALNKQVTLFVLQI